MENLLHEFAHNKEFQKISRYVKQRNRHLFQIIARERDEITFSRTLRYYLAPKEDHNFNDTFLKAFLSLLITKSKTANKTDLNKLIADKQGLRTARVYREYFLDTFGRADIIIELPKKLFCLIEVKLYSGEGDNQTTKYADYIKQNVEGKYKNILQCFLTPEGLPPENQSFIAVSMQDLLPIFKYRGINITLNEKQLLLKNFSRWIKELAPMSKDLKVVCRRIYQKYQKEIETIIKNAPTITAFFNDISEVISKEYHNFLAQPGASWMAVSPKDWLKAKEKYSPIRVEYNYINESLHLSLVTSKNAKKVIVFIEDNADRIFKISYRKWDSNDWIYYDFNKFEEFKVDDFIDEWDKMVEKYAKEIIEKTERVKDVFDQKILAQILTP